MTTQNMLHVELYPVTKTNILFWASILLSDRIKPKKGNDREITQSSSYKYIKLYKDKEIFIAMLLFCWIHTKSVIADSTFILLDSIMKKVAPCENM